MFIERNFNQPYFIVQVSDNKSYKFTKEILALVLFLLKTLILKKKKS